MGERAAHSPLGASGAERWMSCPGSVGLVQRLDLPPSDESEYAAEGTAAHAALEKCLREGLDAWEVVGQTFEKFVCTVEMADAIQLFIDTVRPTFDGATVLIEERIDDPTFHPEFYGRVDCAVIAVTEYLDISDFKYGAGIAVDAVWNPQIMYYAYGVLRQHPDVREVKLRIVQPRAFHPEGPVREWVVDAQVILDWARDVLRPAMERTATDNTLQPGAHCRFCPAKLACPAVTGMFEAAMRADPAKVVDLSDAAIEANYEAGAAVKSYLKALEEEAFRRLNLGRAFTLIKLVHKKANRVWVPGAVEVLTQQLGADKVMTPPEFKSPAQVEMLGGRAKDLVKEYSHTPESGLTVALASSKSLAVVVKPPSATFAAYVEANT